MTACVLAAFAMARACALASRAAAPCESSKTARHKFKQNRNERIRSTVTVVIALRAFSLRSLGISRALIRYCPVGDGFHLRVW
jgi:hypothetical protein